MTVTMTTTEAATMKITKMMTMTAKVRGTIQQATINYNLKWQLNRWDVTIAR